MGTVFIFAFGLTAGTIVASIFIRDDIRDGENWTFGLFIGGICSMAAALVAALIVGLVCSFLPSPEVEYIETRQVTSISLADKGQYLLTVAAKDANDTEQIVETEETYKIGKSNVSFTVDPSAHNITVDVYRSFDPASGILNRAFEITSPEAIVLTNKE